MERAALGLFPELRTPPTRSRTTHVGEGTGHRARTWNYSLNSHLSISNPVVLSWCATSRRTWHCYSAAGAPADAKAITRLVPRRDNRRDRDVATAQAVHDATERRKRWCGLRDDVHNQANRRGGVGWAALGNAPRLHRQTLRVSDPRSLLVRDLLDGDEAARVNASIRVASDIGPFTE